MGDLIDESWND